jgi:hypothetical protein
VNNFDRLYGPSEQSEADMARVRAERILCEWM